MTKDIVRFDSGALPVLSEYANQICKTEFVPGNLRNKPEAVLACIMTGQELGIPPMQSLRQIDVIDGRPALRSELMRAKVLEAGHEIWFGDGQEFTTTRVVCYGRRQGSSNVIRVEWTLDMAQRAGLAGKNNWKNHPRAMMSARAGSEVCRLLFPDIIAGMGYSREELEDGFTDDIVYDSQDILDEDKPKTAKRAAPSRPRQQKTEQPAARVQVPEPSLPDEDDEIVDAEIVDDAEPVEAERVQTPEEKERSQVIVRKAKGYGVDHHHVISAITNGVKSSARFLDASEGSEALMAVRAVGEGRLVLRQDGDNWHLDEATPVANDDGFSIDKEEVQAEGAASWDTEQWRNFLKANDCGVVALLKQAAVLSKGKDGPPPGSLASLGASGLAEDLKQWVLERQ